MHAVRILLALLFGLFASAAFAEESLWAQVRKGGHALVIRHTATTPGVGDPPGFVLTDCATQRNLSAEGIADAKRLGERFRAERVVPTRVLASQWCRTQDTARLAFGSYTTSVLLNSTFPEGADRAARAEALRDLGRQLAAGETWVLVTHGNNIGAAFGVFVAQGDMVVAKPGADGRLVLVGTIAIDSRGATRPAAIAPASR